MEFRYRKFGRTTIGIKFGIYTINLKVVKTKKKEKQFLLTIADNRNNTVVIRGYPEEHTSFNRRNYICDRNIHGNGNWKIEYVSGKKAKKELLGRKFGDLTNLLCTVTPQDANELGPVLEDFIRNKFYTTSKKSSDFRGNLSSNESFRTSSTDTSKINTDDDNFSISSLPSGFISASGI